MIDIFVSIRYDQNYSAYMSHCNLYEFENRNKLSNVCSILDPYIISD